MQIQRMGSLSYQNDKIINIVQALYETERAGFKTLK